MAHKVTIPLEILDRFSAPVRKFQKNLGEVSQATQTTKDKLSDLQSQAWNLSSYSKLNLALEKNQQRLVEARTRMEELKVSTQQSQPTNKRYVQNLRLAETQLGKLGLQEQRLEDQFSSSRTSTAIQAQTVRVLRNEIRKTAQPTEQQRQALAQAEAQLKQSRNAHKQLALSVKAVSIRQQKAKEKVDKLKQSVEQSKRPTAAMVKQFERAKAEVKRLEQSLHDQNQKLSQLRSGFDKAGMSAEDFARAQKRNQEEIRRTTQLLERQERTEKSLRDARVRRDRLRNERGALLAKGAGVLATGYAVSRPVKRAISAEDAFADVIKFASFDEDKSGRLTSKGKAQAAQMQQTILGTSIEKGLTFEEASSLYSFALQNKQTGKDTGTFAENAADMAIAFDMEAQQAALTLSAWRNAMKLNTTEALKLANATNFLSDDNAGVFAKDIAEVLARTGSTAKAGGLNSVQAAAFTSALLSSGKSPEMASTALKNISITATQGSKATPEAQKALTEIGLDAGQLSQDMKRDAPKALLGIFQAIQRNKDNPEINGIVAKIFGRETIDAVMPLAGNMENLKKVFKSVGDESRFMTSIEKEVNRRMDTRATELKQLSAAYQAIQINIGNAFIPILHDFLVPMTGYAKDFATFAENNRELTKTIFGVAAGMTAVAGVALTVKAGLNVFRSLGAGVAVARGKMNSSTKNTARFAIVASRTLDRLNSRLATMGGASMAGADQSGRKRKRGKRFGSGGILARGAAKASLPAVIALEAINMGSAVMSGDGETIAGAAGSALGAGASIAAGAAIGSIIPGVGTLVGGIVGGVTSLFTSEIGEDIGQSIWNWFDDEDPPKIDNGKLEKQVSELVKKAETKPQVNQNQQITYSPNRTYQFTIGENTRQEDIDQIKMKLDEIERQAQDDFNAFTIEYDVFKANGLAS